MKSSTSLAGALVDLLAELRDEIEQLQLRAQAAETELEAYRAADIDEAEAALEAERKAKAS
jgi:hypothetical protein